MVNGIEFECEGDGWKDSVVVFKTADLAVPRAFVGSVVVGCLDVLEGLAREGGVKAEGSRIWPAREGWLSRDSGCG